MMQSVTVPAFDFSACGRSLLCLVAMILGWAAAAGRLRADDEAPEGIRELARLSAVSIRLMDEGKKIEQQGRYGFSKSGHCLLGASLAPGASVSMEVALQKGTGYHWYAAGDSFAKDVDLEVFNSLGVAVDKDVGGAPTASVTFVALETGQYTVKLTLFKGTDTSFCALVLMETDGWLIPVQNVADALGQFVLSAGGAAATVDRMSGGRLAIRLANNGSSEWCLFGTVMKQQESRTITKLKLGDGLRVFLSAGCGQAQDIDVKVIDQAGNVIAEDLAPDAKPMGIAPTRAKRLYDVTTMLPGARGAALTLTGIVNVEPANQAVIRPAAETR